MCEVINIITKSGILVTTIFRGLIKKIFFIRQQVGIVSQVETAAQKKANVDSSKSSAIFERQLTSVYTAATLIGDDIKFDNVEKDSPTGCRQTILSVVGEKSTSKICLVTVEPLTGQVMFDESESNMLEQRLGETKLHTAGTRIPNIFDVWLLRSLY